jgi:hypothetical protein
MLLRWEHDDLCVGPEVDTLAAVFSRDFGFAVDKFTIPVDQSVTKLSLVISNWMQLYDHHDNLFILYYAGHGRVSDAGRRVIWLKLLSLPARLKLARMA